MTRRGKQRAATERLGIHAEAGGWCTIDKIPHPPADVLQAADNPRLRPARMRPLGMLGAALGAPFILVITFFEFLAKAEEAVMRSLDTRDEKERLRVKKEDEKRRRDAITAQQGIDKVFDGNWHGDAGQFLLRWYGHSTHHQRLLLATTEGIALAAPPRRVSAGREKHLQIVARLSAAEATLADPFSGEFKTRMLLIRFQDGSWLRVDTEEFRSDLHMYVLRQPLTGS
ncbi:hypothetical protein GCM10010266_49510 [Streptomyces griseomycini]|uniref:hypothetical protein n=1 Tax=Streptomyces griseomycini TaxID=66895 RepID=UPI0018756B3F|nr:hypothetical protein [Streptomyces griseomycini]GGQ20443.1 hypothetical protein GCM10010266_49510 [Streptomyces griseomycini]